MALIINADDFGMTKEINEGIIEAYKQGAITSVSIINGPEKEHAIESVKKHGIPCGIHLCKKGPVYLLFIKSLFSKKFGRKLEIEFEQQILNIKKDVDAVHVDSHKHIHMFPPIFDIVVKLVKKHDLRLRLSKNIDIGLLNRLGLKLFYPRNKKKALKNYIKIIDSHETSHKKLNRFLNEVKEGEIIVHPGTRNGKIKRLEELQILLKNEREK